MEVDAEKDGVEQTATVGIVFDVRFKLHENLADKPYLDTTDRSGKSLRQKAEDRNRFAHNRRGNSVSNDRNRYGSRDGSSGWGNKDSYSEKYKSSSNREGERGRKARSNRDDGYNQEVIELGPWGGGTISQRGSEGGGDWIISTEPSQQNYQDGWGESRRPRNETSRRRDEENGWSVVHMDPEVNNHTGAVGNEAQYEDSARISSICDILRAADVLGKMKFVEAKMATEEQLLLVHSEEYLKIIKSTKSKIIYVFKDI
ncbi:hypothetical protein AX774_g4351 [Zancudomyces culisetae]|uniref:Histone deacetylase n=1 Tax=Zancudomyces culisetae TaxID=1213189 RepID=A0A1R1PMM2_ZANCU|nr:hypothetical protein AX774_g4351 [Zancudomyces culisetae]|eukprot:OMH82173.1 hypothetical protein AX774_g4351 [Zancudomyces culisetae]